MIIKNARLISNILTSRHLSILWRWWTCKTVSESMMDIQNATAGPIRTKKNRNWTNLGLNWSECKCGNGFTLSMALSLNDVTVLKSKKCDSCYRLRILICIRNHRKISMPRAHFSYNILSPHSLEWDQLISLEHFPIYTTIN